MIAKEGNWRVKGGKEYLWSKKEGSKWRRSGGEEN